MWIQEPAELMAISDERFWDSGLMFFQKNRMEHALAHAHAIPSDETLAEATAFVAGECGIDLSREQMLAILSLYPAERGKLADYGWGDTEIRDLTHGVVAHFFLSSGWPLYKDNVDIKQFVARLRQAADFMGYQLTPQEL